MVLYFARVKKSFERLLVCYSKKRTLNMWLKVLCTTKSVKTSNDYPISLNKYAEILENLKLSK